MPPADNSDRIENTRTDIVLLIHGTGAGAIENEGEAWWQRESQFWHFLQGRLLNQANIQPADHVFHWSGDNSERERRSAGNELASWLSEFEKDGQPYHLIGHSHGGSVIWRALNEATARGCPLAQLRSCTTVGTPFFLFSPKPLARWIVLPILTSLLLVAGSAFSAFAYLAHIRDLVWERDWATLVALPFLWLGSALILAWWIGPVITWFLARRDFRRDRKLAKQTANLCFGRFSPISAALDEAINGLTTTLGFEGDLVPRNATRFRWFRAIYNNIVARGADEFVWDRGSSRLQGNDYGGFTLTNVLRSPISDAIVARIPPDVENRMVVQANRNAASTIAGIRDVLGLAAVSGWHMPKLAAGFRNYVNWGELIHTTYFSVPEVAQLILENIEGHFHGLGKGESAEAVLPVFRETSASVSTPPSPNGPHFDHSPTAEPASLPDLRKTNSLNSRGERGILDTIVTTAGVLLNVVLGIATWALFTAGVKPHTKDYLLQRLLRNAPITVAARSSPDDLGKWISALLARQQNPDVVATIEAMGNSGNGCRVLIANQTYTAGIGWQSVLLDTLVDKGVWTVARDAIDRCSDSVTNKPDRESRIDAELTLAETLLQHHHVDDAKNILIDAVTSSGAIKPLSVRAVYFAHLAGTLQRAGLSAEAEASISKAVQAVSDDTDFNQAFDPLNRASAIAFLVDAKAYEDAARLLPKVLTELKGTTDSAIDWQSRLVAAFAWAGRLSELQQVLGHIPIRERWKLPYVIPPTDTNVAAVIKQACPTPDCKASVDVGMATALVRVGKTDQAAQVLKDTAMAEAPILDLFSLAGEYIKAGEPDKGVDIARTAVGSLRPGLVDEQFLASLSSMAELMKTNGHSKEAGDLISTITVRATNQSLSRASSDQWFDGPMLFTAAKAFDEFNTKEASNEEWRKAIAYARSYETRGEMGSSGSDQLVHVLVEAKRFDMALEVTHFINAGNIEHKVSGLTDVAEGLFRNGDVQRSYAVLGEAIDAAATISDSKSQSRAVGTIAAAAAICHRYHLAYLYADRTSLEDRIGVYTRLLNVL